MLGQKRTRDLVEARRYLEEVLAGLAISNARVYTQTDKALTRRVDQLSALGEIAIPFSRFLVEAVQ